MCNRGLNDHTITHNALPCRARPVQQLVFAICIWVQYFFRIRGLPIESNLCFSRHVRLFAFRMFTWEYYKRARIRRKCIILNRRTCLQLKHEVYRVRVQQLLCRPASQSEMSSVSSPHSPTGAQAREMYVSLAIFSFRPYRYVYCRLNKACETWNQYNGSCETSPRFVYILCLCR